MSRPNWNEYFLNMAQLAAERSTCLRRKVGAVLVKDKRVLATGYNGAPKGIEHCNTAECLRSEMQIPSGKRHEICRGVHAEQNLIAQAAIHGVKTENAVVYCTYQPCSICTKILINAGITKIYYKNAYNDNLTEKILKDTNITIINL